MMGDSMPLVGAMTISGLLTVPQATTLGKSLSHVASELMDQGVAGSGQQLHSVRRRRSNIG